MSSDLKNAYSNHPRKYKENRYVYAVLSRRAGGISIGINLNPDKGCNFDCVYCQVDRSIKSKKMPEIDLDYIAQELEDIYRDYQDGRLGAHPLFNKIAPEFLVLKDISLSGDGEPTMAPEFTEVCRVMKNFQERVNTKIKLQVISNATLFHLKRVSEGLEILTSSDGVIWGKLDAGSEEWFHKMERTRYSIDHIQNNLETAVGKYPLIIQSMWCGINGEMPAETECYLFAERVQKIYSACPENFQEVHLYTLARKPSENTCVPVSEEFLISLRNIVELKIPKPVKIFYS